MVDLTLWNSSWSSDRFGNDGKMRALERQKKILCVRFDGMISSGLLRIVTFRMLTCHECQTDWKHHLRGKTEKGSSGLLTEKLKIFQWGTLYPRTS